VILGWGRLCGVGGTALPLVFAGLEQRHVGARGALNASLPLARPRLGGARLV
jgi:hypothetical protein